MRELVLSGMLAGSLIWLTLPAGMTFIDGRPPLFRVTMVVALLAHFAIGDFFHWRRFPRLSGSDQRRLLGSVAAGVVLFGLMRQAGAYRTSLFYVYFLAHFWKDVDLSFRTTANGPTPGDHWIKWVVGIIVVLASAVLSSGLVSDPSLIHTAVLVARGIGGFLMALGLMIFICRPVSDRPSATMMSIGGILLLGGASFTVFHPVLLPFRDGIVLWHVMLWYVISYNACAPSALSADAPALRGGIDRLRRSPAGLLTLIIAVHALFASAAWLSLEQPRWAWLRYVMDYNFLYVAGGWAVLHITWNWVPTRPACQ